MKLTYKIRKLKESDALDAIQLYARSCRYLEYFQNYFGEKDCENSIIASFSPDVIAAIRTGVCVGCYNGKELIGIIFSIDWTKYVEENMTLLDHMFNLDLDSTDELLSYMEQYPQAHFIFAIGTKDGYRCQGIAKAMLKHYLVLVSKKSAVVTDCIYEYAQSLWWSNSFVNVELDGMSLAVKTP